MKKKRYILGIQLPRHSSVSLFESNKLVECVQEERFSRKKGDIFKLPNLSLKYLIKKYNLNSKNVECINYSGEGGNLDRNLYKIKFLKFLKENKKFQKLILKREKNQNNDSFRNLTRNLISKYFKNVKINFFDHHSSHAASAIYGSNYDKAIIFTLDGRGNYKSGSVFIKKKNKELIEYDYNLTFQSLGFLYGQITDYLGFVAHRHEGKITGLAAYGNYNKTINFFKKIVQFKSGKIKFNYKYFHPYNISYNKNFRRELKKFSKADIAAGVQKITEDIVIKWIKYYCDKINYKANICLAGGVFSNVKINHEIRKKLKPKNLYIFPAMGDSGLSFGANCLYLQSKKIFKLKKYYDDKNGISFSDKKIKSILFKNKNLKVQNIKKFYSKSIADEIINGKIVGLFRGKMEFGPRALLNRSIICRTDYKNVNDVLNKRLNRTEFMPFAPVTIPQYAKNCFINWKNHHRNTDNMTEVYKCTKLYSKAERGVVHLDYTARPQVIRNDKNFAKIIQIVNKKTKLKSLINTSFNAHEEPIVATPQEAINNLLSKRIDILFVGNFKVNLIKK